MIQYFFKAICLLFLASTTYLGYGQELQARVKVIADQMPVELNRRIFQELEISLTNFLNTQRWTTDQYENVEKISCNFILNMESYAGNNTYTATLNVQGLRPVYNSVYLASLLNVTDREVVFQYVEGQNIAFNETSAQGIGAPLQANLTAVFAFYAYLIIGLDYASFSLKDGNAYFQKAFDVVNAAPDVVDISGWKPHQSRRNRYWIADIFTNPAYNNIYEAYYKFYRGAMDNLYKMDKNIPTLIIESLEILYDVANRNQRNLSIFPIFIQGKKDAITNIFKTAGKTEKEGLIRLIEKIDPSNVLEYERAIR